MAKARTKESADNNPEPGVIVGKWLSMIAEHVEAATLYGVDYREVLSECFENVTDASLARCLVELEIAIVEATEGLGLKPVRDLSAVATVRLPKLKSMSNEEASRLLACMRDISDIFLSHGYAVDPDTLEAVNSEGDNKNILLGLTVTPVQEDI